MSMRGRVKSDLAKFRGNPSVPFSGVGCPRFAVECAIASDDSYWWKYLKENSPKLVRLSQATRSLLYRDGVVFSREDIEAEIVLGLYPLFVEFVGKKIPNVEEIKFLLLRESNRIIKRLAGRAKHRNEATGDLQVKAKGRKSTVVAYERDGVRGKKCMIVDGTRDITSGDSATLSWLGTRGDYNG